MSYEPVPLERFADAFGTLTGMWIVVVYSRLVRLRCEGAAPPKMSIRPIERDGRG